MLMVAEQLRELARNCEAWAAQFADETERQLLLEQARNWERTARTFEAEAAARPNL
jgi:hypothetical protein